MRTSKVKIGAYLEETVDVPHMVLCGANKDCLLNIFHVLRIDPRYILRVKKEEELRAFLDKWVLLICEKFNPSTEFIRIKKDVLFISTDYITVEPNFHYIKSTDATLPQQLYKITGLKAFKAIQWEPVRKIWFLLGKVGRDAKHAVTDLTARYTKEMMTWIAAGSPVRDDNTIRILWDTFCSKCAEYKPHPRLREQGQCNLCGCHVKRRTGLTAALNKLAVATASCAHPEPRFQANVQYDEELIKGREQELFSQYVQMQSAINKQEGRKGCNCGSK